MKSRLAIITEIISPYRIPLFNALAASGQVELKVIFLSETDLSLRQWRVYKEEIRFPSTVLASWRRRIGKYNALLNAGLTRELEQFAPDVILCGGYSYVASWQAWRWARLRGVPFLLWSESVAEDKRRNLGMVERLKRRFLDGCRGFVVPGIAAGKYLESLGVAEGSIYRAPNAVDNEYFSRAAAEVRGRAEQNRRDLGLPKRYCVFVGRLVEEKGVFDLLRAYAALEGPVREELGLVFVGDGACRQRLETEAGKIAPGVVRFTGFAQREQLPAYYALADALVLPTYTDTWGLVVNEAMACGLPIVLSRVAGCGADLVRDNWNGLLVSPRDTKAISEALRTIARQPDVVVSMRERSAQIIREYSPEAWSQGVVKAAEAVSKVSASGALSGRA